MRALLLPRASRFAAIAQLVEHLIRNEGVGGSNPSCGTIVPPKLDCWERLRSDHEACIGDDADRSAVASLRPLPRTDAVRLEYLPVRTPARDEQADRLGDERGEPGQATGSPSARRAISSFCLRSCWAKGFCKTGRSRYASLMPALPYPVENTNGTCRSASAWATG